MEAVTKFDNGLDPLEGETHETITASLSLENAMICGTHRTSLSDLVGPKDAPVFKQVG
jgi:hypothetical protein